MTFKILIFGAGAIGSLIGGFLSKAGLDVTLIGRENHIKKIRENGLKVISPIDEFVVHPKAFTRLDDLREHKFDAIFVTVKAYDTKVAAQELSKVVSGNEYIISLQNGLGTEDIIRAVLQESMILRGITSHGAMISDYGVVRHTGLGEIILGPVRAPSIEILKEIVKRLTETGLEAKIVSDIKSYVWLKVLVNAAINPIATLLHVKNGELIKDENIKTLMRNVIFEGIQVVNRIGVTLPEEPITKTFNVVKSTSENKCSMLQDIERGKRTEIDYLNGAIVYQALIHNLEAPVNDTLTKLIKGLEILYKAKM
ncbi:MAG: ketopantoate reductase family protein [Candidatus Asgardarchaeia archaeon]